MTQMIICKLCKESRNWLEEDIKEKDFNLFSCIGCGANLATGKVEDDYTIILGDGIEELKKRVNLVMKQGYKPIGKLTLEHFDGETFSMTRYYQPMIKRNDNKN